jgi:hypothetical protein
VREFGIDHPARVVTPTDAADPHRRKQCVHNDFSEYGSVGVHRVSLVGVVGRPRLFGIQTRPAAAAQQILVGLAALGPGGREHAAIGDRDVLRAEAVERRFRVDDGRANEPAIAKANTPD